MKWQAMMIGLSLLSIHPSMMAQWFGNNSWMPFNQSYGNNWTPFNRSYGNGFMPYFSQSNWGMNPNWRRNRSPFSWWGGRYGKGGRVWPSSVPYSTNIYDQYGEIARYSPYYPQNAQAMLPFAPMYGAGMLPQSPLLPPPITHAPVTVTPSDEQRPFSPF